MSACKSMVPQCRWAGQFGRPVWRLVWFCLALALLLSAAAPSVAAASPIDADAQPNLHSRVIGVLSVIHDAVDRNMIAVAASPAEARRLQAEAIAAWRSGEILR